MASDPLLGGATSSSWVRAVVGFCEYQDPFGGPDKLSSPARQGRKAEASSNGLIGEFDPGSERTLAAGLTHASRARKGLRPPVKRRTGE